MASLFESGKYRAINTTDTTANGFYVIVLISEAYTLQENTTVDGQIITAGELAVKEKYICSMQVDTNWYWDQQPKQHVITVPTRRILYPQLEVNAVTDFYAITTSVCTRTQEKQIISIQHICLNYSYCDYILEEISFQDKIEFERYVEFYSDKEGN